MTTTIVSGTQAGIYLTSPGTVTVSSTGDINIGLSFSTVSGAAAYGIIAGSRASTNVYNYGSINTGTTVGSGVLLAGGGTVVNAAGGYIYAGISEYGRLTGNVAIYNSGIINQGVVAQSAAVNATIVNDLGGYIGNVQGVEQLGIVNGLIENDGLIANATFGVIQYEVASGVIQNAGLLQGLLVGAAQVNSNGTIINDAGATIVSSEFGVLQGGGFGAAASGQDTLINSGFITAPAGVVVSRTDSSITNTSTGTISGSYFGIYAEDYNSITNLESVTLDNAGVITGGTIGVNLINTTTLGNTVINTGTIASGYGASGIAVASGLSTLRLGIGANAVFYGQIIDNPSLNNVLELVSTSSAGTLSSFGTEFAGFSTIVIDPNANWTLQESVAALSGIEIDGLAHTATLDLTGVAVTSESFANGTLSLYGTGGLVGQLLVTEAAGISSADFTLSSDGAGGTVITNDILLCYLRGTRILTPRGDVAVEALAIGDYVATRFGGAQRIKWLGRQSYDRRFLAKDRRHMPVKISAGALGRGLPLRDLFVSPGHCLLLGETLVLARQMVNGITICQGEAPERIDYVQIELDGHDCVLAEGCWAESFADAPGLRAKYHNAAEFWALYPDYVTPEALALCAPRPEHGPALEVALRPVLARAEAMVSPGGLQGWIDWIGADGVIEGWAWDTGNPELPVALEVLADGEVIGTVLACQHRADLEAAGYGNGQCSFRFLAQPGLAPRGITMRRAADGAALAPAFDLWERVAA